MPFYRIRLRETRLATDGTDDVALFDVTQEEDGTTWIVPAYLSPLFRLMQMRANASPDRRREMVAGLGARAIVQQLTKGVDLQSLGPLMFTVDYPGAPGDPEPLSTYAEVTVEVEEGSKNQ